MTTTVLIVEDNNIICHGLETLLGKSNQIKDIWVAKSAETALEMLADTIIDVAIVDISLPGMDGLTFIKTCHQLYPSIKFIVLSSHEDAPHVLQAFSLGIHAYCTKSINNRIVSLVDEVAQGAMWVDPAVSHHLIDAFTSERTRPLAHTQNLENQFTPREQKILDLLAHGKNNQQIADEMHFSVHSVKVYLSKIFTKLGVEDRTQAAVKALQHNVIGFTNTIY